MVSEKDTIYVLMNTQAEKIGSGFSSTEEIEEYIKENYSRSGNYTYGILSPIGECKVEEPEPKLKNYTEEEKEQLREIKQRAEKDRRVNGAAIINNCEGRYFPSVHCHRIRYENCEVDFSMSLSSDIFDSVPLSTIDKDIEDNIKEIFRDIVGENMHYLGFNSSYAGRGRKDPFVRVYGRLHRQDENQIRNILSKDYVKGMYWTDENISPVPIYFLNGEKWEQDYIIVLKYISQNDSYDEIEQQYLDEIKNNIQEIKEETDFEVDWIGKVAFRREYGHTAIGITK